MSDLAFYAVLYAAFHLAFYAVFYAAFDLAFYAVFYAVFHLAFDAASDAAIPAEETTASTATSGDISGVKSSMDHFT